MSFPRSLIIKEAQELNHSQEYIDQILSYSDNLTGKGLPVIFSTKHFSLILNSNLISLQIYLQSRNSLYKYYTIKKKRGGVRQLCVPYSNLREIQSFIYNHILSTQTFAENVTGFVKNKSIKDTAVPHANKKFILNIDLLKFFDSITEFRVYKVFEELGYEKNLAVDLAKLTTTQLSKEYYESYSNAEKELFKNIIQKNLAVLPQGSPTSPALSNLVLRSLDNKLIKLAKETGCEYTRYADDITFSNDSYDNLPRINKVVELLKSENLYINWKKVKIYKRGQRQLVTGLTISDGVHVPKKYRNDVKRHLFFCKKFGPINHMKKLYPEGKGYYKQWLLGRIYYILSIDRGQGIKLLEEFNKINWPM